MLYTKVSNNQMQRYPTYLKYLILKKNSNSNLITISPSEIAKDLKLSCESVRKDFQAISPKKGIPKIGRHIDDIINDLEIFLGYHKKTTAVLFGVGHLGKALLAYKGFYNYGIEIVSAYDTNPELIGKRINNIPIYDINNLNKIISAEVAIIAVPKEYAQDVANKAISCGIKAIYNFSPLYLVVDDDVIVETIDIASSIALLSARQNINRRKKHERRQSKNNLS